MMKAKGKCLTLVMALVMIFFSTSTAWAGLQQEIENSLICPACLEEGMLVATCPDNTAEAMRQEIAQKLAGGQGKDEIIQAYLAQYGKQILSVPEKSGFDLAAWVVPFGAICLGGGVMYSFIKHWVTPTHYTGRPSQVVEENDKYAKRIEQEIRKRI